MPLALPAEVKKITPYIRRAEELDRDQANAESRLVAYYCRQYAVQMGIALAQSAPSKTALGTILTDLEKEKPAMSAFTRDESKFLCAQFANKIFLKADDEDRAGLAGKNTAKSFYAAATFIEILQQFYGDDDDSEERQEERKKIIYSKWKATEILKAIKEGREPTPGGYGEQIEEAPMDDFQKSLPQAPHPPPFNPIMPLTQTLPTSPPPTMPSPSVHRIPISAPEPDDDEGTEVPLGIGPPPAYPGPSAPVAEETREVFVPLPPPVLPSPTKSKANIFSSFTTGKASGGGVSKVKMADATELTRFALAALESKDADLAITRLQQALQTLGR